RGVEVRYDMIGDADFLNGTQLWITNKNIEKGGVKAKLWGKMELIVAGGKWELTWHGYKIGKMVTIDANGVGVEGKVKGMVTKMTMEMKLPLDPCNKEFDIEGYISK
ncbi:MAG: hypothetical protein KAI45_12015, partial [Melioribacteraceae bacterium]|nr:hypothetical protein [Melioribacteraceae bacterium]